MFNILDKKIKFLLIFALLQIFIINHTYAKNLYCNKGKDPVERAGVILIKKYDKNDYAIFLGKDRNQEFVNFPAGMVDNQDKYIAQTAARETYEETAKSLRLDPNWLKMQPYIYSKKYKILLYIIRDDKISVRKFNNNINKLIKDKTVKSSYKEVEQYYAIPVTNLISAAKKVAAAGYTKNSKASCYYTHTRGNPKKGVPGREVKINRYYLSAVAENVSELEKKIKQIKD